MNQVEVSFELGGSEKRESSILGQLDGSAPLHLLITIHDSLAQLASLTVDVNLRQIPGDTDNIILIWFFFMDDGIELIVGVPSVQVDFTLVQIRHYNQFSGLQSFLVAHNIG